MRFPSYSTVHGPGSGIISRDKREALLYWARNMSSALY